MQTQVKTITFQYIIDTSGTTKHDIYNKKAMTFTLFQIDANKKKKKSETYQLAKNKTLRLLSQKNTAY